MDFLEQFAFVAVQRTLQQVVRSFICILLIHLLLAFYFNKMPRTSQLKLDT